MKTKIEIEIDSVFAPTLYGLLNKEMEAAKELAIDEKFAKEYPNLTEHVRLKFIMIFASPWGDTWRCEERIGNTLLFTNHDSLTAALEYARQQGYDETNTNIY